MRLIQSGRIVLLGLWWAVPATAQLSTGAAQPECPAGMMPAPEPPQMGMGAMPTSATGAIASAAKKKLLGSKNSAKDSAAAAAVPAKPKCLTPEQFAAEAKAQQSAAVKNAATAALSATPIGMAVVAGKAAAPVAGKVAGAISNRFRRGPSKESMVKQLGTGRLEVENVSFDPGADSPTASSQKSIGMLAEALKAADGKFTLRVTPESNGVAAADPKLAFLRGQLLMASLVAAGVPADKLTVQPPTTVVSWESGPPKKTEAKLEVFAAVPPSPKQ